MIKISSLYPFFNFLRVTYEFHEEKAVVKMKSLKFERESEFEYKDVGEISDAFEADMGQLNFGFWLLLLSGAAFFFFYSLLHTYPIWLRITQVIFLCGLFLYILGFKRNWWFYIRDKNSNTLLTIKQTSRNRDLVPQVLELIRNGSDNLLENSAASPFRDEKPAFEHNYSYINDSKLKRITDRFYDTEIRGAEQSIYGETAYNVQYDQLSGKVYRSRAGIGISEAVFGIGIVILELIIGLYLGFRVDFGVPFSYLVIPLVVIYLLSLPFDLIKREIIGFYDKKGNIDYWAYVNRADKENVEEIIKFVLSKIPPVSSDELLKEQA